VANVIRNVWANAVIFCGHFPDGAEKFTKTDMVGETKGEWYLRQMLGSANFEGGPVLRFMSGNLCHQIEHHLYPICRATGCTRSRCGCAQVCEKYDLPYTTGSFLVQYGKTWRTIAKLSLPDKYLRDTADDAPETRSERMFAELESRFRRDRPGDRASPRAQDGDRSGPRLASGATKRDVRPDLAA
jgi:fatty acid desaturase